MGAPAPALLTGRTGDLARELTLAAGVAAAAAWTETTRGEVRDRQLAVRRLRREHERVLRLVGSGIPERPDRFLELLAQPAAEWLPAPFVKPGDEELVLLEDGRLSQAAEMIQLEYRVSEADSFADEAVEQHFASLLFASHDDETYRAARRQLILNAALPEDEALLLLTRLRLRRDEPLYGPIPASSVMAGCWWQCPFCRWPMRVDRTRLSCAFPPHSAAGADYMIESRRGSPVLRPRRTGRGAPEPPAAQPATAYVALVPGIWRFILVPGLVELELEAKIPEVVGGADVTLWPRRDEFDLAVVLPDGRSLTVDVKDWTSASLLRASLLRASETGKRLADVIVVPDYRRQQVHFLRENARELGVRFAAAGDFLRSLKRGTA